MTVFFNNIVSFFRTGSRLGLLFLLSALLTGFWCAAVRGLILLDLSTRWHQHRARRLR